MLKAFSARALQRQRSQRVDREGSPYFRHSFGEILTTAREHIEIETLGSGAAGKYKPLDYWRLTNNSAEDVDIYVNGTLWGGAPAGTILSDDTPGGLWFFAVHNVDTGTVASGQIFAQFRKQPQSADKKAREG